MARKFTENEVRALTRNKREEKSLKSRLEKLTEEKGMYFDTSDKEKKQMVQLQRQNRRSTGSCPFTKANVQLEDVPVDKSLFRRFSKPWAVCPNETTYNVMFKEMLSTSGSNRLDRHTSLSSATPGLQKRRRSRKPSQLLRSNSELSQENKDPNDDFRDKDDVVTQMSKTKEENICVSETTNANNKINDQELIAMSSVTHKNPENRTNTKKRVGPNTPRDTKDKSNIVTGGSGEVVANKTQSNANIIVSPTTKDGNTTPKESLNYSGTVPSGVKLEGHIFNTDEDHAENRSSLFNERGTPTVVDKEENALLENITNEEDAEYLEYLLHKQRLKKKKRAMSVNKLSNNQDINQDGNTNTSNDVSHSKTVSIEHSQNYINTENTTENLNSTSNVKNQDKDGTDKASNESSAGNADVSDHDGVKERVRPATCAVDFRKEPSLSVSETENHNQQRRCVTRSDTRDSHIVTGSLEVLEFDSLNGSDEQGDFTFYKGQKIRNYVAPHQRYKHDPFHFQRREKLLTKLTKEHSFSVTEYRKNSVKANVNFSKAARDRLHKQLVNENCRENTKRNTDNDNDFGGKIKQFLGSISYLCDESVKNKNKDRHPLLA